MLQVQLVVLLIASNLVARPEEKAEQSKPIFAATVFGGQLLCLSHDGTVNVWDLKTGSYSKGSANSFSRKGLQTLTTDGKKLWAADGSSLYQWSASDEAWKKSGAFDSSDQSLVAIVSVGGLPLLVFPSKVLDVIGKRTFQLPKALTPFTGPRLRILATHGTESMLWIGTGNGEWGGYLFGLDPKADTWIRGSGDGYVTGVTSAVKDELIVSWSMSHLDAHTRIQIHKLDGAPKKEYPVMKSMYYQRVAYNAHDETLYGVESKDVVTIKDGKPSKVATLDGGVFEREPMAMGVAPGILALLPIGPKAVVIVPKTGEPWLLRDKELSRLRTP